MLKRQIVAISICTINSSQPCTKSLPPWSCLITCMGRHKHNEFLLFKNAYKMVNFFKKINYFSVFKYFDMLISKINLKN
jgi:hypothetical protein